MVKKVKKKFICNGCGYETPSWLGKCPDCGSFNSFIEDIYTENSKKRVKKERTKPKNIKEIKIDDSIKKSTNVPELDRVLGGGIVSGSLVLVGGEPGIGKSTLLLQMLNNISEKTVYVSGEESLVQIKSRAERLNVKADNLLLYTETDIEEIFNAVDQEKPALIVIDSIQTVYYSDISSIPGSITQVRECTVRIMEFAKNRNISVFIVGHVTKSGSIAGPKVLEHMVDVVLYFEGDSSSDYRLLRTIKNRFGPTNEIGIFEMGYDGLTSVTNPSKLFIQQKDFEAPGTAVTCAVEGSRPLLVEIQSLTSNANYGTARRIVKGLEYNRVSVLLAVIENKCRLNLITKDIFMNIVGGINISEPAADMAVVAAVISNLKNKVIPVETVFIGELGLTGEVRNVSNIDLRLKECLRLGYTTCMIPKNSKLDSSLNSHIVKCSHINQLMELIMNF